MSPFKHPHIPAKLVVGALIVLALAVDVGCVYIAYHFIPH